MSLGLMYDTDYPRFFNEVVKQPLLTFIVTQFAFGVHYNDPGKRSGGWSRL